MTRLYAFVYNSDNGELTINDIKGAVASASILETGQDVNYCQTGDSVSFRLPEECDKHDINVIAVALK